MYKVKDIRVDLYLEGVEYNEFWKEWKNDIVRAIRKQEKIDKDFTICLESDLQSEEQFLDEENKVMEIITIDSGVVFYKVRDLEV